MALFQLQVGSRHIQHSNTRTCFDQIVCDFFLFLGSMLLFTANAGTAGASGLLTLSTGSSSSGSTGSVVIGTGSASSGRSGSFIVSSGDGNRYVFQISFILFAFALPLTHDITIVLLTHHITVALAGTSSCRRVAPVVPQGVRSTSNQGTVRYTVPA